MIAKTLFKKYYLPPLNVPHAYSKRHNSILPLTEFPFSPINIFL